MNCLWLYVEKIVPNGDLRLFHLTLDFLQFKQTVQTLIRRRILRRLMWVCSVANVQVQIFQIILFYTTLWRHSDKNSSDKNSGAINNRYLDFIQTRGLISLVYDNHVDNTFRKILVYVYYDSTVNTESIQQCILRCWHVRIAYTIRRLHISFIVYGLHCIPYIP